MKEVQLGCIMEAILLASWRVSARLRDGRAFAKLVIFLFMLIWSTILYVYKKCTKNLHVFKFHSSLIFFNIYRKHFGSAFLKTPKLTLGKALTCIFSLWDLKRPDIILHFYPRSYTFQNFLLMFSGVSSARMAPCCVTHGAVRRSTSQRADVCALRWGWEL